MYTKRLPKARWCLGLLLLVLLTTGTKAWIASSRLLSTTTPGGAAPWRQDGTLCKDRPGLTYWRRLGVILKAEEDGTDPDTSSASVTEDSFESGAAPGRTPATSPASKTSDEKRYPIDLPSPLLLSSSMVLAIASVGSLFELVGEKAETLPLGFAPTAAIAAVGAPLAIFLFLAAIQKATAETEEDDRNFMQGR